MGEVKGWEAAAYNLFNVLSKPSPLLSLSPCFNLFLLTGSRKLRFAVIPISIYASTIIKNFSTPPTPPQQLYLLRGLCLIHISYAPNDKVNFGTDLLPLSTLLPPSTLLLLLIIVPRKLGWGRRRGGGAAAYNLFNVLSKPSPL